MAKLGVVLSCYDKVDDLLAHLDILSFDPDPKPVIICYMGQADPPPEFLRHHLLRFRSPGFTAGTLVSLFHALRLAPSLGLDFLEYRNSDDWLFRHDLPVRWVEHMVENDQWCAGYNWFSSGTFNDITMNECFVSVPRFLETLGAAEEYVRRSDQRYNCEYKMAWWARQTVGDMGRRFYRLPGREIFPGIGWLLHDYVPLFERNGMAVPEGFWERLNSNNRFFNREWQLIGSHLNIPRLMYWSQIRAEVPYADRLERCHHFSRWLWAATNNLTWNSRRPNSSRLVRTSRDDYPVRTLKQLPFRLLTGRYESPAACREFRVRPGVRPPQVMVDPAVYLDN
jgi:hypothetical protein